MNNSRICREVFNLQKCTLEEDGYAVVTAPPSPSEQGNDQSSLFILLKGPANTPYENKTFTIKMQFTPK